MRDEHKKWFWLNYLSSNSFERFLMILAMFKAYTIVKTDRPITPCHVLEMKLAMK